MKKIIAYGDTETTGVSSTEDQILDYATVFTEKNEIIETINREIIVKKNVVPAPRALLVNNINPFSEEWNKKAIHEFQAVDCIITEMNKYRKGNSFLYVAYNAPFDAQMFEQTFLRCGKDFNKLVPVIFDLYLLAKHLIDSGKLITKKTDFGYSGKLGDVYEALGFTKTEMNAHNALGDSIILPGVANKLYMLYCGKEISDITIDPSTFKSGDIYSILYIAPLSYKRQRSLQFEEKTILVVHNDTKHGKLHIVDQSQMSIGQDLKFSQIIDYAQVFDEASLNSSQYKIAQKYKQTFEAQLLKKDQELSQMDLIEDNYDLPDIEAVKKVLSKIENKEKLTLDEQALESRAEELSYSSKNEGWSFFKYGSDYKDKFKSLYSLPNLSIGTNPLTGSYEIRDENDTVLISGTKTAMLDYLITNQKVDGKNEVYKEINAILTKTKAVKNEKNLQSIKDQFNAEKLAVFNGANKLHKEILSSLLKFYKNQYPDNFNDIVIPDFKLNLAGFKKKV